MKTLKYIELKGINKRISIKLLEREDGSHVFYQQTKTLIDRKNREFAETNNVYSVETFAILSDVFHRFMQDGKIKNKILHSELSKIVKFKGNANF